jgi:hypothetical protein
MALAATNGFFAACTSKIEVRQKNLMVGIPGTLAHFVDRCGSLWSITSGRNASAMTRGEMKSHEVSPRMTADLVIEVLFVGCLMIDDTQHRRVSAFLSPEHIAGKVAL